LESRKYNNFGAIRFDGASGDHTFASWYIKADGPVFVSVFDYRWDDNYPGNTY
jgi:hypothetical protein